MEGDQYYEFIIRNLLIDNEEKGFADSTVLIDNGYSKIRFKESIVNEIIFSFKEDHKISCIKIFITETSKTHLKCQYLEIDTSLPVLGLRTKDQQIIRIEPEIYEGLCFPNGFM